jgi:phosphatidylinositol glycan class V
MLRAALEDAGQWSIPTCALLSRLAVIVFASLCGQLGTPYDTSWLHLPARAAAGGGGEALPLDGAVLAALAPLARWDGVYYLHLASPWGSYGDGEHLHAFLPGFPFALRAARALLRPLEAAGLLSPRPALLLGGVLLNVACFVIAAVALEALTARVLGRGGRAAALAFCASPGGVFFSAVYTEAPFAAATFCGLLALESVAAWDGAAARGRRASGAAAAARLVAGAAALAAAAAVRSNGALGAGFIAWALLRLACGGSGGGGGGFAGAARLAALLLVAPLLLAAPLLPLAAFQAWAGSRWCGGGGAPPPPSWCPPPGAPAPSLLAPPPLYAHVQAAHWGVGFLRRWGPPRHAPALLLAAPMVACACGAAFSALRGAARALAAAGWPGPRRRARAPPSAAHALAVLPYALHFGALAAGGALVAHPQVVTRLCASACPALYWALSAAWERAGEKGARHGPLVRAAIAAWCVGYTAVGAALFSNFYNWT